MPETQETPVKSQAVQPSRRQFITKSAAAVAGAAFISPALSSAVYAAGNDKLKVGLVGCGGRGCGAASQAIHADEGTVLTAVCDLFKDQAEKGLGEIWGPALMEAALIEVRLLVGA